MHGSRHRPKVHHPLAAVRRRRSRQLPAFPARVLRCAPCTVRRHAAAPGIAYLKSEPRPSESGGGSDVLGHRFLTDAARKAISAGVIVMRLAGGRGVRKIFASACRLRYKGQVNTVAGAEKQGMWDLLSLGTKGSHYEAPRRLLADCAHRTPPNRRTASADLRSSNFSLSSPSSAF